MGEWRASGIWLQGFARGWSSYWQNSQQNHLRSAGIVSEQSVNFSFSISHLIVTFQAVILMPGHRYQHCNLLIVFLLFYGHVAITGAPKMLALPEKG